MPRIFLPGGDGIQCIRMRIARHPVETGKPLGEPNRMFARAAGDLQDDAGVGEPVAEHVGDRLTVPLRRGGGPPGVFAGRTLVEAPFVGHSAACAGSGSL